MKHKLIEKAEKEYKAASEKLILETIKAFPLGTLMTVEIGGNNLSIRVTDHNENWWCDPGQIWGQNINTLKCRKFYRNDIVDVHETP